MELKLAIKLRGTLVTAKTSRFFLFPSKEKLKAKLMARGGVSHPFCEMPFLSLVLARPAFTAKIKKKKTKQTYSNTAISVFLDWLWEGEQRFPNSPVLGANCSFHAHLNRNPRGSRFFTPISVTLLPAVSSGLCPFSREESKEGLPNLRLPHPRPEVVFQLLR